MAVGKIGAQEDAGDASQIEYGPDIFGEVYRDERIVQDSDAPGDDGYEAEVRILRALVAGYAKAGYSPYGGSYAEKLVVAVGERGGGYCQQYANDERKGTQYVFHGGGGLCQGFIMACLVCVIKFFCFRRCVYMLW